MKTGASAPFLWKLGTWLSSSSRADTKFGYLHTSHVFWQSDADTYFHSNCKHVYKGGYGIKLGHNASDAANVDRLNANFRYLLSKTFKDLFPAAAKTFTILHHLQCEISSVLIRVQTISGDLFAVNSTPDWSLLGISLTSYLMYMKIVLSCQQNCSKWIPRTQHICTLVVYKILKKIVLNTV